jgi:hypothetical protein
VKGNDYQYLSRERKASAGVRKEEEAAELNSRT